MNGKQLLISVITVCNSFFKALSEEAFNTRSFRFLITNSTCNYGDGVWDRLVYCEVKATCDNFVSLAEGREEELCKLVTEEVEQAKLGENFLRGPYHFNFLYHGDGSFHKVKYTIDGREYKDSELTVRFGIPSAEVPSDFFKFAPGLEMLIKERKRQEGELYNLEQALSHLKKVGIETVPAQVGRKLRKLDETLFKLGKTGEARTKRINRMIEDYHKQAAGFFGITPKNKKLMALLREGKPSPVLTENYAQVHVPDDAPCSWHDKNTYIKLK